MKKITTLTLILFSIQTFALSSEKISNLVVSMSDFSEKVNLTEKDLPELNEQLKNILVLEKVDESHEGPFELSESYPKNKVLYQKAIKSFSKKDQKILQNILKIVEDIGKNKNG